ncbi:MAG: Uma2 family endonuclease [Acidobacteria bacterium]|nr:Uma2 family endonuclease [Acidobacteriota bacterium]
MTADELLRMPDDGFRYELIEGELRKMSPAGSEHGLVTVRITWRLASHVESRGLGAVFAAETGFIIASNPDTVRAPDVAFVSRSRLDSAGEVKGYWPGAPDLAVEVVSPNDSYVEVDEKAAAWLAAGTRLVVVLNPRRRTASLYHASSSITILDADAVLDLDEVVADFRVPVKDLFN